LPNLVVSRLTLFNVRSHHELTVDFGALNLLVGPNGSGKTNILEAVSVASTTRSWRAKREAELVRWNEDFARIRVEPAAVEVVISRQPYRKNFWIDGVKSRARDVLGVVKTVLFQPDDMMIATGAPLGRRHFMNVVLSQRHHEYGAALLEYAQVLAQRNRLLKRLRDGEASGDELSFWDAKLVSLAEIIWGYRASFIKYLEMELTGRYAEISGDGRLVSARHETKPHDTGRLLEELAAVRDREIILGQTLRGPHRDDLHFLFDGHMATEAASRGELRSLTFALKMIELDYLSGVAGSKGSPASQNEPSDVLLLLDDIMSELDAGRRERLVTASQRAQTIITTTDPEDIPDGLRQEAKVVNFGD
jgi:DNA replication and repair protein RecF